MSVVGNEIKSSGVVAQHIESMVAEVTKLNSKIEGIRGPQAEQKETYQQYLQNIAKLRGRPLHYNYIGSGAGRGPFVELLDGSVKLDLINGIGIHLMGHAHPRVIKATVRGAVADIVNQGNLQPNYEYIQLTEKLVNLAAKNSRLRHAWFATCGTMANENALKLCRQKRSPAKYVIAFKNAFAGRSTMMAELTDNPAYKQGLPEYNEILRIPFYEKTEANTIQTTHDAMKAHIDKVGAENIACFVFEPMLGEGGYQAAPREFFIPILELCKTHGIAVWADEVQTFTRTGELFAFETLGIGQYIDLVTIAKTAQLGATLYTEEYNPKPGLIAGTFSGATTCMSAGMEILDILQEGYLGPQGRIQQIHHRFINGFNKMNATTCKGLASDAGGMGLMIAFTPFEGKKEQVDSFLKKLFENGVIAFPCGKTPVRARFLVPAIISDTEIDLALNIIEKTLLEGV